MRKRNIFNVVFSMSVLTLAIGCSNMESPVSVSESNSNTVADIGSVQLQEISAASADVIWGKSFERVGTGEDYKIMKYIPSQGNWSTTQHYGKLIAASPSGLCYHVNSINEVWIGDGTNGWRLNIHGLSEIRDITVSRYYDVDIVRILGESILFMPCILSYDVYIPTKEASNRTLKNLLPLNQYRLSADPSDKNRMILACTENVENDIWIDYIKTSTDGGKSWSRQQTVPGIYYISDVAIRSLKYFFSAADASLKVTNYHAGLNNSVYPVPDPQNLGFNGSLAVNKDGLRYNMYYLTKNNYPNVVTLY